MVEPIGEDLAAAVSERGEDREVGEIARRQRQRARLHARPHELRERGLECCVRRLVAADEMRRAGTRAERLRARGQRGDDPRIGSKPEVVVAGEGQQRAAVDVDARPLRRVERAARARETLARTTIKPRRETLEAARHAGASPSLANSARSASTSGLPVVRSLSP